MPNWGRYIYIHHRHAHTSSKSSKATQGLRGATLTITDHTDHTDHHRTPTASPGQLGDLWRHLLQLVAGQVELHQSPDEAQGQREDAQVVVRQVEAAQRLEAGQVVQPADGVDVLLDGPLPQGVVPQHQDLQVLVDEDRLRQELQVAAGQVGLGGQLGRRLRVGDVGRLNGLCTERNLAKWPEINLVKGTVIFLHTFDTRL